MTPRAVHWFIRGRAACHTPGAFVRTSHPERVTCLLCLRLLAERLPIVRDERHLRLD